MGFWGLLGRDIIDHATNDSYNAGFDASEEWEDAHENSAEVPDGVVKRLAQKQGEDEEAFLKGWRVCNEMDEHIDEQIEKVSRWWPF